MNGTPSAGLSAHYIRGKRTSLVESDARLRDGLPSLMVPLMFLFSHLQSLVLDAVAVALVRCDVLNGDVCSADLHSLGGFEMLMLTAGGSFSLAV